MGTPCTSTSPSDTSPTEVGRLAVISTAHLPSRFRAELNVELDNQPPLHSRNHRFHVRGAQDIFHIDPYAAGWYFRLAFDYRKGTARDIEASASRPFLRDLCLWMRVYKLSMVQLDADGPRQPGLPYFEDGEDLPS